jgi:hypothetical protein
MENCHYYSTRASTRHSMTHTSTRHSWMASIFEEWVDSGWGKTQKLYYIMLQSRCTGKQWRITLIRKLWQIAWNLWEHLSVMCVTFFVWLIFALWCCWQLVCYQLRFLQGKKTDGLMSHHHHGHVAKVQKLFRSLRDHMWNRLCMSLQMQT